MKRLIFVGVLIVCLFTACSEQPATKTIVGTDGKTYTAIDANAEKEITDYGNGIYYFAVNGRHFSKALSRFISNHPELEIVCATGDGTGYFPGDEAGRDIGYTVVFRKKQ
ncbi:MAG: hypothetical protein LBH96_03975 [Candidatus Peribacteria bacterium]|jgi:hypothetical protein|nr:hypothetical protein [Candidatus Peribacteria bacterium]